MARILFVAILVMCLVCTLQASQAAQGDDAQSNPMKDIEAAAKSILDSTQKGVQAIIDDPGIKKVGQDVSDLVLRGLDAARQYIKEATPKTQ